MASRWTLAASCLCGCLGAAAQGALAAGEAAIVNPAIDIQRYLRISGVAARFRETHRLSQDDFIRLSREPGTIVLDARSKEKYDELHIKGAVNLSFPDIAVESLQRALPDRHARILIYCNNNFVNGGSAFPVKAASASLNIATYITLYDYGYRNVYELGPLIDLGTAKFEFQSAHEGRPPRPVPGSSVK